MFDIAVSFIIVMVLLAPVTALIALFIRLDSPGPVIFKPGEGGAPRQEFHHEKFRTMYIDTPAYATHPMTKTIRASPVLARFFCAVPVSTNCRSCGMC
jgi:lipopolysaccharide/colanic/teichoic acid biosynthesis glycosyltransferase